MITTIQTLVLLLAVVAVVAARLKIPQSILLVLHERRLRRTNETIDSRHRYRR